MTFQTGGDANGLTPEQVEDSRRRWGSNQLIQEKRTSFFSQFLQTFADPIIKILLVALAINIVFLFRRFDWYEAAGIFISIFLATFVSTLSEYGSESAFRELEKESAMIKSRVRRDGSVVSLSMSEIVCGDIVLLQSGERIPADGVLLSGEISVDQSSLNGESREVTKRPADYPTGKTADLNDPANLFSGTVICGGEGVMQVERVGAKTIYGSLAHELQGETRESPLKLRLAGLAKYLSRIGYIAAILVAAADLTNEFILDNGMNWAVMLSELSDWHLVLERLLHALTLAITTVVVAVPEGLPMMITIVLSSNMRRMLKDHVLVRKLVGIETSGSLNILFTDKTGTLTNGKLNVCRFLSGDGTAYQSVQALKHQKELWMLVQLSCAKNNESLVSKNKIIGGNGTDKALMEYALPLSPRVEGVEVGKHIPFNSKDKFSAVALKNGNRYTLVKGAPERIMSVCTRYFDAQGEVQPLRKGAFLAHSISEMTSDAMRVLALAVSEKPVEQGGSFEDLILVGLVGIRDQIRGDARAAVKRVHDAGVQVVMITGDNRETAVAIARDCGLLDRHTDSGVITSDELKRLSDDALRTRLTELRVVARALPADKSRLIRVSQNMGLVVGMTGDGVNDAPALKIADVGFAMGSGTEVAKQAGDIVVLNNSFSSIAKAILYGRTIFKSIRKFIIFQLTMNLCAVGVSIIAPFIGIDTPITVVQMLWVNIIMDTLAGLAFSGEPPLSEYMKEAPKKRDEPIINSYMISQIFCTGIFTVVLCIAFLKLPIFADIVRYEETGIYFLTAFFALFIFCGIFNSFNARTNRLNIMGNLKRNPLFLGIMGMVCVVQLLIIYFGGAVFRTAGLAPRELVIVVVLASLVIPADFVRKLHLRTLGRNSGV